MALWRFLTEDDKFYGNITKALGRRIKSLYAVVIK